jgi:hypothetical protein
MRWLALMSLLLAAVPARGGDPCPLVAGSDRAVVVQLAVDSPSATQVAGVKLEVDHPEAKVGLEGEGIKVPATTISDTPSGVIATANDLGDRVRIVVSTAEDLPTNKPLLTLHFSTCKGAPAAAAGDFACKVLDVVAPTLNKVPLPDVRCTVTLP